ncbi:hypothetical protein HJD18_15920 [Thermoleophilia bacterium SCSIO 60948]|nr:hypothetical protein HJD18_15920 [Thermoleophilia bacterium SCSIO 60948]
MIAFVPPVVFVVAVVLGLLQVEPPGPRVNPSVDEALLVWVTYLALGWNGVGGAISHTIFAKPTAASIGWPSGGFQYEVGFANLAFGAASIYAVHSGSNEALATAVIGASVFLVLAGINHVRGMARERNFAPGNSVILLSDFGAPAVAIVTLISTGTL